MTAARNRKPHDNDQALSAFVAGKTEFDGLLARLQQLSDDHFGVLPDEVNWGHVTSITDSAALLRRITDAWFSEGEHAA